MEISKEYSNKLSFEIICSAIKANFRSWTRLFMHRHLVLFITFLFLSNLVIAQCNGHIENCDKRYNEVSIVMTHNSYNIAKSFRFPNQTLTILEQLEAGVRGLMLDFHAHKGEIVMMHHFAFFGTQPAAVPLKQIKSFLETHPKEVITIIIESHVSAQEIENEFKKAGLLPYCAAQQLDQDWPTLNEMIQSGQRLVVFSEKNDGLSHQDWYLYAWDYIVDTPYSYHNCRAFNCTVNRGHYNNKLILVNHWLTTRALGTGRKKRAHHTNSSEVLNDRVKDAIEHFGRKPTFIGIDFPEKGASFEIIQELNNN